MPENHISKSGKLIAISISSNEFTANNEHYFSPSTEYLQLGINSYPAGSNVPPHYHNIREIQVKCVQEILYISKGTAKITLFDENNESMGNFELNSGDIVFFISGGHGIEFKDDTRLIEVKQGPYIDRSIDKTMINSPM